MYEIYERCRIAKKSKKSIAHLPAQLGQGVQLRAAALEELAAVGVALVHQIADLLQRLGLSELQHQRGFAEHVLGSEREEREELSKQSNNK